MKKDVINIYYSGYNRLFWGMVFILFHINIGYITILPNFIAYLFIYSGLNILSSQHEAYKKLKLIVIILILLSLKDIFYNSSTNFLSTQFYALSLSSLIDLISGILNIYLIYTILNTIHELCEARALYKTIDNVVDSFNFYFITSLIILFFIPFSLNLTRDLKLLIIIPGIFKFIASVIIAGIFRRCRLLLKE